MGDISGELNASNQKPAQVGCWLFDYRPTTVIYCDVQLISLAV